jgi:hypothetical protein
MNAVSPCCSPGEILQTDRTHGLSEWEKRYINSTFLAERICEVRMYGQTTMKKYIYWLPADVFLRVPNEFRAMGIQLVGSKLTPCETLRCTGTKAVYASPAVFQRMCFRQGSWYAGSNRNGKYLLLSPEKLPRDFDAHLDSEMSESSFLPDRLPSQNELLALVESEEYQTSKPDKWERKTLLDAVMFKILFTLNRCWKWGDHLKKHWLGHRANHANFLAKRFTTEMDGDEVPYTLTENSGVCSSCVEFFNITNQKQRKLVRACPGSITFGGAKRDVYLDVKPVTLV